MVLNGGYLCGAVRYRLSAPPTVVTHCHCRTCRRATGAPFVTWLTAVSESFEFTAGKLAVFSLLTRCLTGVLRHLRDDADLSARQLYRRARHRGRHARRSNARDAAGPYLGRYYAALAKVRRRFASAAWLALGSRLPRQRLAVTAVPPLCRRVGVGAHATDRLKFSSNRRPARTHAPPGTRSAHHSGGRPASCRSDSRRRSRPES